MNRTSALLLFSLASLAIACSGSSVSVADTPEGGRAESGPPSTGDAAGPEAGPLPVEPDASPSLPGAEAGVSGGDYLVHLRVSQDSFAHSDGNAGQTTSQTAQGVRTFFLLRTIDDPSPVKVLDLGSGFVEAKEDPGDDTRIGAVPSATIPAGRYVLARIGVSHSRFRVESRMHYGTGSADGIFDCVQALSDNTEIGGEVRKAGYYRYTFELAGKSYPQTGTNAPLPAQPTAGGFTLKTSGGQAYYELPIDLTIPEKISGDTKVVLEINMFDAFRWSDQAVPGFSAGVYDTTPISFEPVMRYGANSAKLYLE